MRAGAYTCVSSVQTFLEKCNEYDDFSDPVPIDKTDTVYSIAVADLNGDGHADIVLGNSEAPGVVLIDQGRGRTFTHVSFGDNQGTVYGLAIADVNGDGVVDTTDVSIVRAHLGSFVP